MNDPKDIKCTFIKISEIQKRSHDFRENFWRINTLPIDMEKIIEQRLRLEIILLSNLPVDAWLQSDRKAVIVNSDTYNDERYDNRLRFSLAHEIGHYILHESIYNLFPYSNYEEFQSFIQCIPDEEYTAFEWQANEFAGSLLVPRECLKKEIQEMMNKYKKDGTDKYIYESPDEILPRVSVKLAKPFGVSNEVIERRVKVEKLWPPQ